MSTPATASNGPYVQAAVFCERVITGQDGKISFVDVVEGATIVGPDADHMPRFSLEAFQLAISLWEVPVPSSLLLRPLRPDGTSGEPMEVDTFDRDAVRPIKTTGAGVNIFRQAPRYAINEAGLYWFDVLLRREGAQDRLLTRIPLTVHHVIAASA